MNVTPPSHDLLALLGAGPAQPQAGAAALPGSIAGDALEQAFGRTLARLGAALLESTALPAEAGALPPGPAAMPISDRPHGARHGDGQGGPRVEIHIAQIHLVEAHTPTMPVATDEPPAVADDLLLTAAPAGPAQPDAPIVVPQATAGMPVPGGQGSGRGQEGEEPGRAAIPLPATAPRPPHADTDPAAQPRGGPGPAPPLAPVAPVAATHPEGQPASMPATAGHAAARATPETTTPAHAPVEPDAAGGAKATHTAPPADAAPPPPSAGTVPDAERPATPAPVTQHDPRPAAEPMPRPDAGVQASAQASVQAGVQAGAQAGRPAAGAAARPVPPPSGAAEDEAPRAQQAPPARVEAPVEIARAAPPRPAAPPPPAEQLGLRIAHAAHNGSERITVQLEPAGLGRVEVQLEVDQEGRVTARIHVERAETLEQLQRDARALERALHEAGLRTSDEGLSFGLGRQGAGDGRRGDGSGGSGGGGHAAEAAPEPGRPQRLLDLHA